MNIQHDILINHKNIQFLHIVYLVNYLVVDDKF